MKRNLLIVVLVILALVGGWYYYRLHRPAPPAASLLPSSSIVFLQIPRFAASRAELGTTAAHALWQEPEVQRFLAEPLAAWRRALDPNERLNGGLQQQILDAIEGEVFVAVTRISVFGGFQAGIVLGADVGRNVLKTKLALRHLENRINQSNPHHPAEPKRYLGVDYVCWQRTPTSRVCYTMLNSLFVCTTGEDALRDLIARHTGHLDTPMPSLAQNPTYQQFVAGMPAGHEFLAFVNMEPIMSLLGPLALMTSGGGAGSASSLQSLASLRCTGATVTFEPDRLKEVRLTLYRPEGHQPEPASTDATLAFTSPDTLLYRVGAFDLGGTYDNLIQALGQVNQPELAAAIESIERHMLRQKLDTREDVLAQLGPQTALTFKWREGAQFPECALITALREPTKTRPALDALMDAIKDATAGPDTPWDEATAGAHRLRTIPINASKIAPTYTTAGDFLVVSLTADFARELITQFDNAAAPTLQANATYQSTMQRLPAGGSSYTWCDLAGLYPHLEGLAKTMLRRDGPNAYVNLEQFPSAAVMAKYLTPFSSATVSTPEQVTTISYSPFGSPIAVVAWAAGGYLASSSFQLGDLPLSLPTSSTPSSSKPAPPGPAENQTAESQTPSSAPVAPAP